MTDSAPRANRSESTADESFDRLVEYIGEEIEFATSYYNNAYLDRRISARMRRVATDTYEEYRQLLAEDESEQTALLDFLSVNVTGFFRNPSVWERLRPALRTLASERRRISAWSAPCSDGREPYSLAMLALEEELDARMRITGTDIDADALERARAGVYETTRTTDIGEELAPLTSHERYVDRDGDRFAVSEAVQSLVSFDCHDLITGRARGPFDLVLCRNLLIYIDAEHKRPVFETITRSLRDGGYLVIGKTESLPAVFREAFTPVDKKRRIYRMQ